jgi:glycerophosphoryl diester phosphodiesterase
MSGRPRIIYHRGRHGKDITPPSKELRTLGRVARDTVDIDESTLPALELAVNEGAELIEVDVRLHQPSGELFITHDLYLDRTTDGTASLNDHPLEYLRRLFSPNGCRLATLDEALRVVDGAATLVLDVKSPAAIPALTSALEREIAAKRWGPEQFVVSSFHHSSIMSVASRFRTGAIFDCIPTPRYINSLRRAGVKNLHVEFDCLEMDREFGYVFRSCARRDNMEIWTWTVNTYRKYCDACAYGVDAIFTDIPDVVKLWNYKF